MFLFSISGKRIPFIQFNFCRSRVEPVNLRAHATTYLPEGEICAVLGRNLGLLPIGIVDPKWIQHDL